MVHGPLTDLHRQAPEDNVAQSCFVTMSRALDELGIPYVDLTRPLQGAARDALARRELI